MFCSRDFLTMSLYIRNDSSKLRLDFYMVSHQLFTTKIFWLLVKIMNVLYVGDEDSSCH